MTVSCVTHLCDTQSALMANASHLSKHVAIMSDVTTIIGEATFLAGVVFLVGAVFIAVCVVSDRIKASNAAPNVTIKALALYFAVSFWVIGAGFFLMHSGENMTKARDAATQMKFIAENQELVRLMNGDPVRSRLSYVMSPSDDGSVILYGRQAEDVIANGGKVVSVVGAVDGAVSPYMELISSKGDIAIVQLSRSEKPNCVKNGCVTVSTNFSALAKELARDSSRAVSKETQTLINGAPVH